jgi:Zn-dependent protease
LAGPRIAEKKNNPWWYLGTIGAFLFAKFKLIISLLKLGTFGGTLLSMAISIWAYALIAPYQLAIGVVLLVFVHEMGHVIAAKQKGLPTSAPIFIPLIGAMINLKRHPRDAETEAYIAFGGPLLGTAGALLVFAIGWYWDSALFIYVAFVGFFINLINLLPIHPLDGGRISVAVSRWLWLVGLTAGLVIIVYFKLYLMFIFWALFAWDLYQKFVRKKGKLKPETTWATYEVPVEPLLNNGVFIPGPEHRRELDFQTYSDLNGKQKVLMIWEEIGLRAQLILPEQGIIEKTFITNIERISKEKGPFLLIRCQVNYYVHQNDAYYEVSPKVRWLYGFAYGLLALLLIYMLVLSTNMGVSIHL